MSIDAVKHYLSNFGMENKVLEFPTSSATVELAAKAVGVEEKRIAKSMSFLLSDGPIIVVVAGDARIDNAKFKSAFHHKAKMVPPELLSDLVGHEMGGVCPFAIKAGVKVYLDSSLKRFSTVFPACGSANSAIELDMEELEKHCQSFDGWVDVCKLPQ